MKQKIKAYKGFNDDWTCKGFQYEVGKQYEHFGSTEICKRGFHACENPADIISYYGLNNKFAKVSIIGDAQRSTEFDSKIVSGVISIDSELTLLELTTESINQATSEYRDKEDSNVSVVDYDKLTSSAGFNYILGTHRGALICSNFPRIQITTTGDRSNISNSGWAARIFNSGYHTNIANSSKLAQILNIGDSVSITSAGFGTEIFSSGSESFITCFGDDDSIQVIGSRSAIVSSGQRTKVKGVFGTHISLAEYANNKIIGLVTAQVGFGGIEPDTWYRISCGKMQEIA